MVENNFYKPQVGLKSFCLEFFRSSTKSELTLLINRTQDNTCVLFNIIMRHRKK